MLIELSKPQPGDYLLDVGCGTGWFTRRLGLITGVEVIGTDIDPEALIFAQEQDAHSRYMQANAYHLPFADDSFQKVVSVTALCFMENWPQALSEIVRVTRDRFTVGLLNHHSLLWWKKGRRGGRGAYKGAHWHTQSEVLQVLAGLPVFDIKVRSSVLIPSATPFARKMEHWSKCLPFGSFLVISGQKKQQHLVSSTSTHS